MLLLSVTLTAAPCAHCTVEPAAPQHHDAAHDCCPKQKQDTETGACGWMPAQYVAPEGATPGLELAAAAATLPTPPSDEPAPVFRETPSIDEDPPPPSPPRFLANSARRI